MTRLELIDLLHIQYLLGHSKSGGSPSVGSVHVVFPRDKITGPQAFNDIRHAGRLVGNLAFAMLKAVGGIVFDKVSNLGRASRRSMITILPWLVHNVAFHRIAFVRLALRQGRERRPQTHFPERCSSWNRRTRQQSHGECLSARRKEYIRLTPASYLVVVLVDMTNLETSGTLGLRKPRVHFPTQAGLSSVVPMGGLRPSALVW